MPGNLIRRLLLLGALAIIGIISIQSYWLLKTWDLKDKEFDQTVHIMLRHVADRIADFHETELPKTKLIQRQSSNYYAVNDFKVVVIVFGNERGGIYLSQYGGLHEKRFVKRSNWR